MRRLGGLYLVALMLSAGCSWFEPAASRPVVAVLPTATPAPERWIHVSKSGRTLTLYEGSLAVHRFPVVLGKEPKRAKLHQGDNRTPEGEYHITKKYPHRGWARFMLLSYPTEENWEMYRWARNHRLLPKRKGKLPGIGGAVGIHGTYDDKVNQRGEDWTRGCVSLQTLDVIRLYDLVEVGTRVVIDH